MHKTKLPEDALDDIYYLTPQVLSRFRSEWTIKAAKGKKSFVDIEDLLVRMIPGLVRIILIQRLDKNATLSIVFLFCFCFCLCSRVHVCVLLQKRFWCLLVYLFVRNVCGTDQTMLMKGLFASNSADSFVRSLLSDVLGSHKAQGERETMTLIPNTWFDLETKKLFHGADVLILPSGCRDIGKDYDEKYGISNVMNNKLKKNGLHRGYNPTCNMYVEGSHNGWTQIYNMSTVCNAIKRSKVRGIVITDQWTHFDGFGGTCVFSMFLIYILSV